MAKTYAIGLGPIGAAGNLSVTGDRQGGRERTYQANFTFASQAAADQIVIARPASGEKFRGTGFFNMTVTTGATATMAVQLNKLDGTTVTLATAVAYVATAVNTNVTFVTPNAAIGTVFDGGEVVVVVAAAALPAAGNCTVSLDTLNY